MESVILYSTGCPKCKILAKKLDMKNVDYQVNDSVDDMQKMGFMELPQLSVDGTVMNFTDAVRWVDKK